MLTLEVKGLRDDLAAGFSRTQIFIHNEFNAFTTRIIDEINTVMMTTPTFGNLSP